MSSFFQDDNDSDGERAETQRRTLESIRKQDEITKARSNSAAVDEDRGEEVEIETVSEEKELEALRRNAKYKNYANVSQKQAQISREREQDRQRLNIVEGYQGSDESEDDAPRSLQAGESEGPPATGPVKGIQMDVTPSGDISKPVSAVAKRMGQAKPKIDPKIIEDSSDESSEGEGNSDNEAPLGPMLPPSFQSHSPEEEVSSLDELPIHHQATLGNNHDSYVSCLALDTSGTRLVSGSLDSTAKFWDFHAMNRGLRSFRSVTPLFESPIRSVQYSSTGKQLLYSGGSTSAVITDREGVILSQTAKGDMYLVDSSRTKGHTGAVLAAKWKPSGRVPSSTVVTVSADATLRIWNIERSKRVPMVDHPIAMQEKIMKLRNEKGGKIIASVFDWVPGQKTCVLGFSDGRLRIIDTNSHSFRPLSETTAAVKGGEEITSVVCAPEACATPLVLVRSSDDALRVFDRRKFSDPVKEFEDLPNAVSETNACFLGETGDHFMTGTSASRKGGTSKGTVRVFDRQRMKEVWKYELEPGSGSVVCTLWHSSINQCIIGTGDGRVRVMYHPEKSHRGILSCLSKSDYKRTHGVVSYGHGEALEASSVFSRGRNVVLTYKGQDEIMRAKKQKRDISNARTPKQATNSASLQKQSSKSLAQHLATKDIQPEWAQDPREAVLKYADIAEKDPQFTKAYQKTQPAVILAEKTAEQEEEETRKAIFERNRLNRLKRESLAKQ